MLGDRVQPEAMMPATLPYLGQLEVEFPSTPGGSRMISVLSLFSGIGGLEPSRYRYGIAAAGLSHKFQVQQFVEISPYSQSQRFKSSNLSKFLLTPNHNKL